MQGVCPEDIHHIGESFGEIRVDPRSPQAVRDIRPQTLDEAKPNTLSSRYGVGSFPFHTDVAHWEDPARFLLLYCEQPGSGARPTHLQDTLAWGLSSDDRKATLTEVWKTGHLHPHLCTVCNVRDDRFAWRFDEGCMQPMTAGAKELRNALIDQIQGSQVIDVCWTAGSMLIIDNHRMLHARGRARRLDRDRVIKRILIGR
jgi:L-asparagine oxygenase